MLQTNPRMKTQKDLLLRIKELKPLINIKSLAELSGLPASTLHSKLQRNTPLTTKEVASIEKTMKKHGIPA